MRIRRKFLQLTKYTYPHGTEGFLKSYLPEGTKKDAYGNFYYLIGEDPTTMFTCHLDTACSKQVKVNHVQTQNIIKTDGSSILGADDKAGMVVILNMIENKVPGLYYFFIGEEVGCVGSSKLAQNWINSEFSCTISKVVSFDRRSDCSVITHQWYGR
jgi:putative aminopeptidase FrvX